ncbi:hypothetical protein [Kribbella sp. CA-293567]|uniref:hypothetical protein n=1 Tax=Kribbella sp. CA-293567 TaxID=3002436 RepID=UPI0022DE6F5F|nr:hypothetical protein [Kribbella sp. CA-293567]WBQ05948.1 hypothetical protein OX958_03885 [Kribbella sp. CA-293567]
MESDLWSLSCSPREVAARDLQGLSKRGLYLVRLDLTGIAGDNARLRELLVAVQTLRRTGILVEYELDLFGESPRFATIRDNVALVRAVVADGTTPATFTVDPSHGQCSPWLEAYRSRVGAAVQPWLTGLSVQLTAAWTELVVGERRPGRLCGVAAHRIALQRLTLRSNTELLNLVADSAREYELTGETQLLEHELVAPRVALLTETLVALSNRFHPARPAPLQQAG